MKVMVNGKEIEIDSDITPEEKEIEEEKKNEEIDVDLEDTLELTDDEKALIEKEANYE